MKRKTVIFRYEPEETVYVTAGHKINGRLAYYTARCRVVKGRYVVEAKADYNQYVVEETEGSTHPGRMMCVLEDEVLRSEGAPKKICEQQKNQEREKKTGDVLF